MGWAEDLWGGLKSAGSSAGDIGKAVGGALINEEAWGDIMPGGDKATLGDFANVALDASMLIPGAGLVGGAARVGGRLAVKKLAQEAAQEAAEAVARKAAMRSPLSNAVRGAVSGPGTRAGGFGDDVLKKMTPYEHMVKKSARSKKMVPNPTKPNAFQRAAGKQQAGLGRKVGMGQTKRRTMVNAGLTGGANLLTEAYDQGMFGNNPSAPEDPTDPPKTGPETPDPQYGLPDFFFSSGLGGGAMSPAMLRALAAMYAMQNGGVAGTDVVSST